MYSDQPTSIVDLPPQLLGRILSLVEPRQRLQCAAFVNSSWRTAANSATQQVSIVCTPDDAAAHIDVLYSLSKWLSSAAAAVTDIAVTCLPSFQLQEVPMPQFQLPVHKLTSLESLTLYHLAVTAAPGFEVGCEITSPGPGSVSDYPPAAAAAAEAAVAVPSASASASASAPAPAAGAAAAAADLSALQSLTSLDIGQCTLRLQGLSALTSLQRLSWADSYQEARADSAGHELCQALPQLRGLTHVTLRSGMVNRDTVVALLGLSALRELQLFGEFSPGTLDQLPQSLTRLLLEYQAESSFPNLGPLSVSSAEGLLQLTALQELTARSVLVSTHHVAALTQLQHLDLSNGFLTLGPSGQSLSVLAGLTRLKYLAMPQLTAPPFEPLLLGGQADLAAVTASSHLTHLNIANGFYTHGQHFGLFPVGRQLPHLVELHVSLGMMRNGASAAAVAAACPSLQRLHLHPNAAGPVHEAAQDAEVNDLHALLLSLQQLQHLAFLSFNAEYMTVSPHVWSALGCLTGLRHLVVDLGYLEHLLGAMHLRSCHQLTQLRVTARNRQTLEMAGIFETEQAAPPDGTTTIHTRLGVALQHSLLAGTDDITRYPERLAMLLRLGAATQQEQQQKIKELEELCLQQQEQVLHLQDVQEQQQQRQQQQQQQKQQQQQQGLQELCLQQQVQILHLQQQVAGLEAAAGQQVHLQQQVASLGAAVALLQQQMLGQALEP